MRRPPGFGVLTGARLAVWGDPITHSRSPALHAAAYAVLGLDWTYERRQVAASAFDEALTALGPEWRGLSVTFPLKSAAYAAARTHDRRAELTGAVNTLLLADDGPHGFNTDVGGIVRALREQGIDGIEQARILGAGATATSALVAFGELGVTAVEVCARRPDAAVPLVALGASLGIRVTATPLPSADGSPGSEAALRPVRLTIATLPGDAPVTDAAADALATAGGVLLDVVYGTWPTSLASAWQRAGGTALSGLGMLLHQALLQVRIFRTGNIDEPLPAEATVLAEMRRAVVGD